MLLDIVQEGNILKISKVNREKKLEFLKLTIPQNEMYKWTLNPSKAVPEKKFKCWYDGVPIYKKHTQYLNKYRKFEFLSNLDDTSKKKIYEFNEPYKVFCDIETEIIDGFPNVKYPKEKVTTVGFYFEETNTAIVYGIRDLKGEAKEEHNVAMSKYPPNAKKSKFKDPVLSIQKKIDNLFKDIPEAEGINFEYKYFQSEYDMLHHIFSTTFKEAIVITGWYFIGFDWKYLTARAKKLGVNPDLANIENDTTYHDDMPQHKLVVDYLEVFAKWGNMNKELENMTLDHVSEVVLGVKKVAYDGNLQDLYESDFEKYVFYNIVDVILVHLLDKKKKVFLTMCKIAQLGGIETRKAFSPIYFTEAVYCKAFYKRNRIMPQDFNPWVHETKKLQEEKGEKIEGGFVKFPEIGLFKILCGDDFASLYPSILRMWGVSPESYMGYFRNPTNKQGEVINVKKDELTKEIVKKNRWTMMGTVFKKEKSVARELLDDFYSNRVEIKKKMKKLDPKIQLLKNELKTRSN